MEKKLKFGGISFGGKYPKVTIYGKTHKAIFGRNRLCRKSLLSYGFKISKKEKRNYFLRYFYFFYPLIDVVKYISINPPKIITDIANSVADKVTSVITIPSWFFHVVTICLFLLIILLYFLLYLLIFKGVRTWHGAEHKVISAAEHNDLDNVKKYNPIHERCGGTLLPTIFFGYIIWMVLFLKTGLMYGEFTIITILLFLNIKFFHKYDKIGIYIGKKIQKYFTVKEPDDWQIRLGTSAMKNLVKAEMGEDYTPQKIVK